MRNLVIASALVLLFSSNAVAQTDPCTVALPPFTVTSGAPFTITWLMAPTVPASPTDPTLVPQRIDGFWIQIDTAARIKLPALTAGTPCPVGTPNAGKLPYTYRTLSGVSRGSHSARINAYNFVLDTNGNPTTTEQEGAAVTVPFAAADLTHTTPPLAPTNGIIRR